MQMDIIIKICDLFHQFVSLHSGSYLLVIFSRTKEHFELKLMFVQRRFLTLEQKIHNDRAMGEPVL